MSITLGRDLFRQRDHTLKLLERQYPVSIIIDELTWLFCWIAWKKDLFVWSGRVGERLVDIPSEAADSSL